MFEDSSIRADVHQPEPLPQRATTFTVGIEELACEGDNALPCRAGTINTSNKKMTPNPTLRTLLRRDKARRRCSTAEHNHGAHSRRRQGPATGHGVANLEQQWQLKPKELGSVRSLKLQAMPAYSLGLAKLRDEVFGCSEGFLGFHGRRRKLVSWFGGFFDEEDAVELTTCFMVRFSWKKKKACF